MQGTGWKTTSGLPEGSPREVPVDPDPVHLAPLRDLDLADDRHVVLALARRHARVAADAGVQVDRHPPLVALIVGVLLPEGEVMRVLLEDAECAGDSLGRPGRAGRSAPPACALAVPPGGGDFDRSSVRVDSRTMGRPSMLPWSWVAESGCVRPSLVSLTPLSKPGALGASDRERVEPDPRADPTRVRTAVAERQGDHAVRHAGEDPDGKLERAAGIVETDPILVRETERFGGLRAHERGVVPGQLGEGSGSSCSHPSFAKRPS